MRSSVNRLRQAGRDCTLFLPLFVSSCSSWLPLPTQETPPCSACSGIYSSAGATPVSVRVSDVAAHPNDFVERPVRMAAVLDNDAGYKFLVDPEEFVSNDGSRAGWVHAEFQPFKDCKGCTGTMEALRRLAGVNNWFDGSAKVVVLATWGTLDGFRRGEQGLQILCIEKVERLSEDTRRITTR